MHVNQVTYDYIHTDYITGSACLTLIPADSLSTQREQRIDGVDNGIQSHAGANCLISGHTTKPSVTQAKPTAGTAQRHERHTGASPLPRRSPNPQTTTNMLSLIPKMGKRPAGCAKRPLFPAESGNKLISDRGSEVLRRGNGEATMGLRRCGRTAGDAAPAITPNSEEPTSCPALQPVSLSPCCLRV